MFEGKTEQQAKEEILESVKVYTEKYHNQKKRGGGTGRTTYSICVSCI